MAACELMQWPSEANFETLLKAAGHRATSGLILALGNYARPESVPLLFRTLEDDLCREEAMIALRKTPDAMRDYALRSLSGMFGAPSRGGSTRARCRATLRLLLDLGVAPKDWKALRPFLADHDSSIVLTVSQIGFRAAPCEETPEIMRRLISAADRFNWLEERDAAELLLAQGHLVHSLAAEIMQHRIRLGLQPDPQMPSWRILHRVADGPVREPPHETASI